MNTIYILWLRQVKKYFRSPARIIGSLGQPLLFLLALGYGFGAIYAKAGGGNYLQFLAPGVICMSILFTSVFSGIDVIWDRQFGFLKETLVAPVSRFKIMLGRTLGGATTATMQGCIVLILAIIFGFRPEYWFNIPIALVVMFIIAVLFTALGTAIASLLKDIQGFQLIVNFLIMPIFFLSGSLFPLTNVPAAISFIASIDPLSYGIDALRSLIIGTSLHSLGLDVGVLLVLVFILLGIGSYLFSLIQI